MKSGRGVTLKSWQIEWKSVKSVRARHWGQAALSTARCCASLARPDRESIGRRWPVGQRQPLKQRVVAAQRLLKGWGCRVPLPLPCHPDTGCLDHSSDVSKYNRNTTVPIQNRESSHEMTCSPEPRLRSLMTVRIRSGGVKAVVVGGLPTYATTSPAKLRRHCSAMGDLGGG